MVLLVLLISAQRLARLIGIKAMAAISKLVMLLLAAIAVNFIRVGITQVIMDARNAGVIH
jgi:small neutral amino acid transporter SnatA (MarC family)